MAGLDSYVKLYCNFNGVDGSTTILDNYGGKTLTTSGDAQLDTAQKKFGSASLLLDGTGDYITVDSSGSDADFDFGSGDFAIDCQVRFNVLPSAGQFACIYSQRTGSGSNVAIGLYIRNDSGTYKMYCEYSYDGSTIKTFESELSSIVVDTWYHIAICREGAFLGLFFAGAHLRSVYVSDSVIYNSAADVKIGATETGANELNGWIDELRVSKGISRYTLSYFALPTTAYTADANDVILLHMDGSDDSTTFTDSSLTGRAVSANGSARIKTSDTVNKIPAMTNNTSPSGESSASSVLSSFYAYKAVDRNTTGTFWVSNVNPSWWAYEFPTTKTVVKYTITARLTYNAQAPKNWTFEGWDGADWDVLDTQGPVTFTSGEQKEFTFSNTTAYIKYRLNVTDNDAGGGDANYTAITSVEMFEDGSAVAPQIGTGMGYFDGSTGYLSMVDSADFDFGSDDFAISSYFYIEELTGILSFYDQRNSQFANFGMILEYDVSNEYILVKYSTVSSGDKSDTFDIVLEAGQWYYLTAQRKDDDIYVYINGRLLRKSTAYGAVTNISSTGVPYVGYNLASSYMSGYLDEFRLTIGATRYATTLSFTPPTEEYGASGDITPPSIATTTATILICDFVGTESAETGTVENEVDLDGHSYNVDDFMVNTTRDNTSRRITVTTSNSFVVASIEGQTVGDELRMYQFTDHTCLLKDSTLNVNKKIQEDTEAVFTLICDPTYLPRAGQYVKINTNGQHVFTGFIRSANRRLPQNGIDTKIFVDCECITLNAIPPRRTVAIAYEIETTVGNIVASLVDSFLVADGVASGTIDDGVVLSEDWYDDTLSIGDILDSVAEQSGFQWMIDKNFNLQFYQDPTTITTYSATISDLTTSSFSDFRNVTINETIDNYNNKAFYAGNTDEQGNLIVVSKENAVSILEMQDYSAGSGVYGTVVRDSNFTQHEFFTATAGTTESTISAAGIGAEVDVGDMLYNVDGYERRTVLAKSGDVLTVDAVSGQTEGQDIATYQQINDLVDNHLKRQSTIPRRLEFDSFTTDFEAGQKLQVVLSKLSVTTTETYVIDEVNIQDRGANYFVAHVVADKRNPDNFSTQRNPNYKDYYRQF